MATATGPPADLAPQATIQARVELPARVIERSFRNEGLRFTSAAKNAAQAHLKLTIPNL